MIVQGKALNGPFRGKTYIIPKETNKVIDRAITDDGIFLVTYYRTRNGMMFHSWKRVL